MGLALSTLVFLFVVVAILVVYSLETFGFFGDQPTPSELRRYTKIHAATLAVAGGILLAGIAWALLASWRGARIWGAVWSLPLIGVAVLAFGEAALLKVIIPLLLWAGAWGVMIHKSGRPRYVVLLAAITSWLILVLLLLDEVSSVS